MSRSEAGRFWTHLGEAAGALRSLFEGKRLQEPQEALNQENHSISDLHQVLSREMNVLFLLFFLSLIQVHLQTGTIITPRDAFRNSQNKQTTFSTSAASLRCGFARFPSAWELFRPSFLRFFPES